MKDQESNIRKKGRRMTPGRFLLLAVQGALIGGGAILPGISGGVLCVTFGIYEPMMELLAHPFRSFRIYYRLFIPVLIGWAAGFLVLAHLVEVLFSASSGLAVSLFVGLIAGTLPSLFRDAGGGGGSPAASWTGFALSLFLVFGFLAFLRSGSSVGIEPNIGWFLFCGLIWGLSLVIPGLSSSSILIFLGLYQPMAAGIAALSPAVILPLMAGILLTVAASARFIDYLFRRFHAVVSHVILGVVVASTLLIVPTGFSGVWDAVLSLLCFAVGFVIAWQMDKYGAALKGTAAQDGDTADAS